MYILCYSVLLYTPVSLNMSWWQVRNWIVPVNRRYPLEELMGRLRTHFPASLIENKHERRHVLIEYVMLQDINDTDDDARRLLELLSGIGNSC